MSSSATVISTGNRRDGARALEARVWWLGGLATLTSETTALAISHSAPDAVALAIDERVLEADRAYRAGGTDLPSLFRVLF
jgi:hypothetical protein